jgi:hypothetical protein
VNGTIRLALLFALVFISRFPFLTSGFGVDPDAWRLATSASDIHAGGSYTASRLPGYPVVEFALAVTGVHEAWQCNILTALLSAGAAVCLALLMKKLSIPNGNSATIAFAFTPVVFINSATTMDYLWALFFVLAALTALVHSRHVAAALLMGLAIGCRISSLLMIIPAVIIVLNGRMTARSLREAACVGAGSLLIGIILYAPVYARYGLGFLTFVEVPRVSLLQLARVAMIDVWGIIGMAAVGWGVFEWTRERLQRGRLTSMETAAIAALILIATAFIRLPGESGYLIPMIPFMFLLFASTLARWKMNLVAISIVASSFLISVDTIDRPWSPAPSPASVILQMNGRAIAVDFLRGPVLHDYDVRQRRMQYSREVIAAVEHDRGKSKLVCGVWYPQIRFLSRNGTREGILVELLDSGDAMATKATGTNLLFIPGVDRYTKETYGYDIRSLGAKELTLR